MIASRIIEGGKGVLNINGVTCSSSNLAANNVSATNVNVSSRINADAATAIFNNVYVKDELRSTTWAIDNITNLGSTFYVSPCIIFTNPSIYINSKSGTTVTLTITDNNIISSSIGGQTWTSGSKIKLMGRINTSVLGVVNGTMARQLNTTTAKTAYITLNFATTTDSYGANTYVNINIGLYGKKTNGASCWFIPFGGRSNSSGTVQKVSTAVQLDSDVRSFSVCIQCAGSGTFSGTLKIRNVSVYRMMGNELIVDGAITAAKIRSGEVTANAIASNAITSDKISAGAITAAKIKSGEVTSDKIAANAITSDKITTNNIAGTNGWINLRSGTFKYNDGALAWDGSTMTIGGFKISKYKITNDAIGICSTAGQEWAFWAGASSGGNAPFHVGHAGQLYASNANITGTINASSLTAKQYYKIYDSDGKNERTFVSWSGSMLSFGLVSQNGSNEAEIQILPGSQTVTFNGDIGATQGTIYAGSIDATGSLSVRKTARMDILTFYDYQQDTLPTASDMIYRRPIASAASNNGRVAFLQGASGNKISIRAQYGKSDFSSATFTASSSDIRLKEDVKDSSVNALSKIMQMQIREFNWKQTGVHQELGCVADELELIDPLLTTGGGYDDDGTMNIKSIDTLLLSEYAIKGIQELYKQNKHQQKRIEYLESQLKNK